MNKRYWLRGLILGLIFGLLVVFAHENISELFNLLGVNIPANPYSGGTPAIYFIYDSVVQVFYNIGLFPGFFLGILIIVVQFFLPPITYGVLGILFGWLYGKFNKKIVGFLIVVLILFVPIWIYLLQTVSRQQLNPQNIKTNNSTQIKRVDTYLK